MPQLLRHECLTDVCGSAPFAAPRSFTWVYNDQILYSFHRGSHTPLAPVGRWRYGLGNYVAHLCRTVRRFDPGGRQTGFQSVHLGTAPFLTTSQQAPHVLQMRMVPSIGCGC